MEGVRGGIGDGGSAIVNGAVGRNGNSSLEGRNGNSSLEGSVLGCSRVLAVQRPLTGWARGSVTGLSGVASRQNTGVAARELAV